MTVERFNSDDLQACRDALTDAGLICGVEAKRRFGVDYGWQSETHLGAIYAGQTADGYWQAAWWPKEASV